MKKHCGVLILLALFTQQGWAGQYAVQLEASRTARMSHFEPLRVHGNLYTESSDNGYIRTRLGPYENKNIALDILKDVRAAGYTDAFITRHHGNTDKSLSSSSYSSIHKYDIDNFDVKSLKEWKLLSPEQQANLVYLDGVLHVKNGDNFTSLDEITGQ